MAATRHGTHTPPPFNEFDLATAHESEFKWLDFPPSFDPFLEEYTSGSELDSRVASGNLQRVLDTLLVQYDKEMQSTAAELATAGISEHALPTRERAPHGTVKVHGRVHLRDFEALLFSESAAVGDALRCGSSLVPAPDVC